MAYGTPLRFSGQARNGRAQQSRETCCVCDNCCAWSGWWRSTVCEFKPNAFVSLSIFVSVSVSPFTSLFLPSLSHAISPQLVMLTEVAKRAQAVLRYLDAIWYSKYRSSPEISTFPLLRFFLLLPFYRSSCCYCSFSQRREAELENGDGSRGRKLQKAPCQRAKAFTSAEVRRGRFMLCFSSHISWTIPLNRPESVLELSVFPSEVRQ